MPGATKAKAKGAAKGAGKAKAKAKAKSTGADAEPAAATKKLAVPLEDPSSDEGSDSDAEQPAFRVNAAFAKGFEARERAKELAYLESKGIGEDSDATSSSESEPEDELINEELDYQLAKVGAGRESRGAARFDAARRCVAWRCAA